MRIAVIGAGIVGVTTAWELSSDGHEVTVFERRGSVAAEASFAEAGLLAPAYFALRDLWAELDRDRRGVRLWGWLRRHGPPADRTRRDTRRQHLFHLAQASQRRLQALAETLDLEPLPAAGLLVLLHDSRELSQAEAVLRRLEPLGVDGALADEAACRRLEPGLNAESPISGALHLPLDQAGNCRQLTQVLRAAAQAAGARFAFHRTVQALEAGQRWRLRHQPVAQHAASTLSAFGPQSQVADDDPPGDVYDAVVVCAGTDASPLLAPLGLRLPEVALHGQSVTAPLREPEIPGFGPQVAVAEAQSCTTVARIGQRVRAASAARRGAPPRAPNPGLEPLYQVLHDRFPGAARVDQAQAWAGRCMSMSDGLPVIGTASLPGLWLNTGHGAMGWTLACGAARALADAIGGRDGASDLTAFSAQRFSR